MQRIARARPGYRARQFFRAVGAYRRGLNAAQWAAIAGILPSQALVLYRAMPRPDQQHAFNVMYALQERQRCGAAPPDAALLQAALLHDVAKHQGGVTLVHRVAVVLLKALRPGLWRRWLDATAPPRPGLLYPLWAHAHHAALGARLAAGAGCDALTVALIAHHQEGAADSPYEAKLLAALRAADDDN